MTGLRVWDGPQVHVLLFLISVVRLGLGCFATSTEVKGDRIAFEVMAAERCCGRGAETCGHARKFVID
jgi:hypothetical protein